MNRLHHEKKRYYLLNTFVFLCSLLNVFPILWMLYSSFKTQQEFAANPIALPTHFSLENFIEAMKFGKLAQGFVCSVFVSALSVFLIIVIGFVIGYIMTRFVFPGRALLNGIFLVALLVPIHALLVPMFIEFKYMGLLDHLYTLVLPYVTFELPVAIFLCGNSVESLPVQVEESALIDGCTFLQRLTRVVFPMCKPIVATVAIMAFLSSWNEFVFALTLVNNENLKTLQVRLASFSGFKVVQYPRLMAALSLTTLPVLLVYFIFHNKIIEGMTQGAVKG